MTDRLRTSSRLNRKEEVTTSRSALTTVKRKFQGGRESLDFIHNFKEMNLDHVLEILYRHLSPSDLLRVVQVSENSPLIGSSSCSILRRFLGSGGWR